MVEKPCSVPLATNYIEEGRKLFKVIKARVVIDVVVDGKEEDFGFVDISFSKDNIRFKGGPNTKIICFSSEVYPNLKVLTPTPSNKVGELEDDRSDTDKTDIH